MSPSQHVGLQASWKHVGGFWGQFEGMLCMCRARACGTILGMSEDDGYATVDAEVPLSEMFGYSTVLRSSTQGKAEFSMEFSRYAPAPRNVQEELIQDYQDSKNVQ